jgi:hypothetical protein
MSGSKSDKTAPSDEAVNPFIPGATFEFQLWAMRDANNERNVIYRGLCPFLPCKFYGFSTTEEVLIESMKEHFRYHAHLRERGPEAQP